MAYASLDKLKQSLESVSTFNGEQNDVQIISHGEERQQKNVNYDDMMDYVRYMGLDEREYSTPSYNNSYNVEPRRHSPRLNGTGRGKLIREAARLSGNGYNKQWKTDNKLKQQLNEAGIVSNSDRDLKAFFDKRFKKKDVNQLEENSEDSSTLSIKPQSDKIAEEVNEEISTVPSSDFNNNDKKEMNEGKVRKLLKPVKNEVYIPPHKRKEEAEKVEAVESTKKQVEGEGFSEIVKQFELKKSQPRAVVQRKTISEMLARSETDLNEKPKFVEKAPKCRNAVMSQFLSKQINGSSENRRVVIPAGYENKDIAVAAASRPGSSSGLGSSTDDSASEDVPPVCWIPSDKTPTARRMFESFVPEDAKPRRFTLEDFIVKKSPKKNKK